MIGERIKAIREEKGYSRKELAKSINISASSLSKFESGKAQI